MKDKIIKIADFNMRSIWPYREKTFTFNEIRPNDNLNVSKSSKDLYIEYKRSNSKKDLDDSNRKFLPMRVLYQTLWGQYAGVIQCREFDKKGYSNFRSNYIWGDGLLFGGDTICALVSETAISQSDIQSRDIEEKMSEYADFLDIDGTIGNYTLVPAYFNKEGHGRCSWFTALKKLKDDDWEIAKRAIANSNSKGWLAKWKNNKKKEREIKENHWNDFSKKDFNKYINCMFFWDYIKSNEVKEEVKLKDNPQYICRIINRRSIFMAAMLKIANDKKGQCNDDDKKIISGWEDWHVSDSYKIIVNKVFMKNDAIYSGYGDVFEEIDKLKLGGDVNNILRNAQDMINEICLE